MMSIAAKGLCMPQASPVKIMSSRTMKRFVVRASDDEDIVPIFTGRRKSSFTDKERELLRHPRLLGGKTIGDELALLREAYLAQEAKANETVATKLHSAQWDGDVYIGGRWNELSVLYAIFMLSPALCGLFAWLSYGHLWGVSPELYL